MRLHDIAFYAALFAILGIAAASLELNIWLAFLTWLAVAAGFYGFRKSHWKYFLILPLIGSCLSGNSVIQLHPTYYLLHTTY